MQPIILHDYQQKLKSDIYNSWANHNKNVLAVLPTGGGKSVCVSDIVLDGYRDRKRQCVMAHRNELVSQMSMHIAQRGIPHRIIASDDTIKQIRKKHRKEFGDTLINPTGDTAVVGVDTLVSRTKDMVGWAKQIDTWIGDEWHHCVKGNKWGKCVEMFTNAQGLGVTATPRRTDGQGLGRETDGYMDDMVIGPTTRELINRHFLCDYEMVCPESDMHVERIGKDGDFTNNALREAARKSHIVGDVVENYAKWAYGRKAIVFAPDVDTAVLMAKKFNEFGVPAAAVSGKTRTDIREKYIEDFREDRLTVLVNVDLFDEGFDVPGCDVVIMARPTMSIIKYLQMVGRALRYLPGKIALIIDHVSNVVRHLLPDKVRPWSLGRMDKKSPPDPEAQPMTACSKGCGKPYERYRLACPHCGLEKSLPAPRERTIEMVEGDLCLLDRATLEKMRQEVQIESVADVANRVKLTAGNFAAKGVAKKQKEKIETHKKLCDVVAQWAGIERFKGFNDREIQKKLYLTLNMDLLSLLDGKRSKDDMQKYVNIIQSWYVGKGFGI